MKMIENPELKVKQLRELKNLTQEYMAMKLSISLRAYSKIESGETQLTIKRINDISQILEVSSIELLNFDQHKVFKYMSVLTRKEAKEIQATEITVAHLNEVLIALKEQNQSLIQLLKQTL